MRTDVASGNSANAAAPRTAHATPVADAPRRRFHWSLRNIFVLTLAAAAYFWLWHVLPIWALAATLVLTPLFAVGALWFATDDGYDRSQRYTLGVAALLLLTSPAWLTAAGAGIVSMRHYQASDGAPFPTAPRTPLTPSSSVPSLDFVPRQSP